MASACCAFRGRGAYSLLPALGIASANVFWLILGVSGAAVLAETYPAGFLALKLIGLLVITYLGLRTIFGPLPSLDVNEKSAPKRGLLYAKGSYAAGVFWCHAADICKHRGGAGPAVSDYARDSHGD